MQIRHLVGGGRALQFEAPGLLTVMDESGAVLLTTGQSRRIEADEDVRALLALDDEHACLTGMYWTDLLLFPLTETQGRTIAATMAQAIGGTLTERL